MNKHTPGPWHMVRDETGYVVIVAAAADYIIVATGPGLSEPDARLIAAGPELLAACEFVLPVMIECAKIGNDQLDSCVHTLRAAIAKAGA